MEENYIIAILVVVLILVCIWHFGLCHRGIDMCGLHCAAGKKEGLHCDCARNSAALAAWNADPAAVPVCDERFRGLAPFKHPNAPCSYRMYNPFWFPYGAAPTFASKAGMTDVPISRMVGDHVPLE